MIKLWRFNKITGYWVYERSCEESLAQQWLEVFQTMEPAITFKLSKRKPK